MNDNDATPRFWLDVRVEYRFEPNDGLSTLFRNFKVARWNDCPEANELIGQWVDYPLLQSLTVSVTKMLGTP